MTLTWRFLADLAERTVKTFAQAYLGYWIAAGPDYDHLLTLNGLKVALAAAAMAVLTSIASKPVGNPDSASLLPPSAQPPAPKPVDETLEPAEAAPTPVVKAPELSEDQLRTLADLVRQVQPFAPAPPPAPEPPVYQPVVEAPKAPAFPVGMPPPSPGTPVHAVFGPVGGRNPDSEGNT